MNSYVFEATPLIAQMQTMKNNFESLFEQVSKMEMEIQNNRKLLAKKDEQITQQDFKIGQLTRTIEEIQEQK